MAFWSKKADNAQKSTAASPAAPPPSAPASPPSAAPQAPASPAPEMSDASRKAAAAVSKAVMAAFGQIVTVLMRTQEHRGQTLADLEWLAVPAVTTGQFALAEAQSKANGMTAPVGLVLWASVSPEIDKRLRTNIASGVRLAPNEWKSGDILWVVEAVGDPKILQAMLQRAASKEWQGREVNLRIRGKDGSARAGVLTSKAGQEGT